jgi:type I restriction enzyme S subunit
VPKAFLESIAVPSLSLDEQRRIAAILDKAEELRAKRRAALALLDQLPQAIFLEMFGDPVTNSCGWATSSLSDPRIATIVGGGTPSRAVPTYYEGNICWATSKDIKTKLLWDTQEHVSEEGIAKSAAKLVPKGTILMVVKSKILARKLPLAISMVPICFGQDIKGIVPSDPGTRQFLFYTLKAAEKWILGRARGVNTEGLTLDHLRAFPFPLPPSDLQRRFDAHVEASQKVTTATRSALANLDSLLESLHGQAFSGNLIETEGLAHVRF